MSSVDISDLQLRTIEAVPRFSARHRCLRYPSTRSPKDLSEAFPAVELRDDRERRSSGACQSQHTGFWRVLSGSERGIGRDASIK
jgi:hypothetical protein